MTDAPCSLDEARTDGRSHARGEPLLRELIGELLRRTRTEQNRTLREVAQEARVSLPYLSEIERGRKEASSEVLAAVYRSLGLNLTDVLGELHERTTAGRLRRDGVSRGDRRPADPSAAPAPARRAHVLSLAA
ncbi:helix-turn-helix transcriptional regulator [Nocardiopsis sp. ATB16-24]|uniref:helix-turn-helix domain-containing protein n=1 Tax=Nocardiopsis sp. ATB16-24 TaxID=3019555 RepID=UPI002554B0C1|nr:helix-turn-helix transcriptional regulator [Nocardiopsis sp. ATB16-24]